jgi:hypothetical protein
VVLGPVGPGVSQWPLGTGVTHRRAFTAGGDRTKYVRLTVRATDGSTDQVMQPVYIAP